MFVILPINHKEMIDKTCYIGPFCIIGPNVKIGKNCVIGGQVGIAGHITIGNNVRIQAQSGIARNVKDNEILQGSPAIAIGEYNKSYVHFKNLTKIVKDIDDLEKKIHGNSKY